MKSIILQIAVVFMLSLPSAAWGVTATPVAVTQSAVCEGRLTLESGVPVSTTDQTSKTTIYFTPYNGNRIALYDGSGWSVSSFTELTLSLGTLTSDKNYDVFVYNNAGTLTLVLSAAWTNNTTRADALALQNGVYVKSGTPTQRHLGTIRTTSTTTTEDSGGGSTTQVGGKRFLWNRYNQARRGLSVIDTTDSWSYTTDTIRQANAASGNKIEYVSGDAATQIHAVVCGIVNVASNSLAAKVGVGLDSTTTFNGLRQTAYNLSSSGIFLSPTGTYEGTPGLGYHYLSWNERGADGSCTFVGDNAGDGSQSGIVAWLTN